MFLNILFNYAASYIFSKISAPQQAKPSLKCNTPRKKSCEAQRCNAPPAGPPAQEKQWVTGPTIGPFA